MKQIVALENIGNLIYLVRGQKVMLDQALADLYKVTTSNLNKAVKRNPDRFPEDFMFQLTKEEFEHLRFQIGISKESSRGGRRYLPYAFTEQGVSMLSSVINSKQAILVNIQIMRTFVRLRQMLLANKDLAKRLDELEAKYDKQFKVVFEAIRQLMQTEVKPKRRIGFHSNESND